MGPLGVVLGRLGVVLEPPCVTFGVSWSGFGHLGGAFGVSWSGFGHLGRVLEGFRRVPGLVSGRFGRPQTCSEAVPKQGLNLRCFFKLVAFIF